MPDAMPQQRPRSQPSGAAVGILRVLADRPASRPALRARIIEAATAGSVPAGALVAGRVRRLRDHGGEQLWLDPLGVLSGAPYPGAAAVQRILARAFPDRARVRITRNGR